MSRRSYSGLMSQPAWALVKAAKPHPELVATIRAKTAVEAREEFLRAGLQGDRVRRVEKWKDPF